jgi:hypothetical protein
VKHDLVSLAIRRAVLLHLPLVAVGLTACGGATSLSQDGGGATCGVTSTTPTSSSPPSLGCASWSYSFDGTANACGAESDGHFSTERCAMLCPGEPDAGYPEASFPYGSALYDCSLGGGTLFCLYGSCGTGRRPPGLRPCRALRTARPVARFLAESAYLEAASVDAFVALGRELDKHRAPARLRSATCRAARDEVRHARAMKRLAEVAGARVQRARAPVTALRSFEEIAIDNAIEGCVRETFGAAVAHVQACRAPSERVRSVMKRIARDETRHAQLSWELAEWFDTRLDPAARRRVARARGRAVCRLLRDVVHEPHRELVEALGIPTAHEARAIAIDLTKTLWT